MELTKEDITKLARLSRLSLTDGEFVGMEKDLDKVLHYVAKVQELKDEKSLAEKDADNILREDKVIPRFEPMEPFAASVPQQDDLLVVPPVFKK